MKLLPRKKNELTVNTIRTENLSSELGQRSCGFGFPGGGAGEHGTFISLRAGQAMMLRRQTIKKRFQKHGLMIGEYHVLQ